MAIGAAVEAGGAKLAGASLDFSGHDPVNGLDGDCVAAIAQQAVATPLSFECAVLTRLVPEHFGKMWKV
jgi:hypothetical protein